VGDKVVLSADVRDIDDGSSVRINIWEKDKVGTDDFIKSYTSYVRDGKVERNWTVEYHEDTDDVDSEQEQKEKGYTMPEYVFKLETTSGPATESGESPVLEVKDWVEIKVFNGDNKPYSNKKVKLTAQDGEEINRVLDENGYVKIENIDQRKHWKLVSIDDGE
jgi:hypothetical protein